MSDTKQINVRLPLELHKALDDHKVRTGEDKSDVIKRGLAVVLDRRDELQILIERMNALREQRHLSAGEIVKLLGYPKPGGGGIASEPRPSRANGSEGVPDAPSPQDTVELAAWLSGRTGMPRALCRRRINENRVTVEDEIFTGDRLEKDRLGSVSLDGKPL